jgi:hypothetical protein
MKMFGVTLAEGTTIVNASIATGTVTSAAGRTD